MFPDFGANMSEEARKNRLTERFKKIKQKHAKEMIELREKKSNAYHHLPRAHRHVRIRSLMRLYDETPDQEVTWVKKDENGQQVKRMNLYLDLHLHLMIWAGC